MADETFGASNTSKEVLAAYGALAGTAEGGKQAAALARQMYPDPEKANPWIAAYEFFNSALQRASEPGQTTFGTFTGAVPAVMDYYTAKDKELAEAKRARLEVGFKLAPALKAGAGKITYRVATAIELARYGATAGQMGSDGKFYDLSPTSGGATKPFDVKVDEEAFKTAFPESVYPDDGIVSLTSAQTRTLPVASFKIITGSGSGSQFERIFNRVNDLGTSITASSLDNNLPALTDLELNEYSVKYQKLISGGEYKEFVNGEEVTRFRAGIDLSETTNLPTPVGLNLDDIISKRAQKFDQRETKSATFGNKMLYTEGIILNVMAGGYVPTLDDVLGYALRDKLGLGTIGATTESKQYHNAAQAWVAAQLRDESGAAIGPTEYSNALRDYFPQVGDDAVTIENKRILRASTVSGMINSSGEAFDQMYPLGRKYMTFNEDTANGVVVHDILNPQGYANELKAKNALGQNLHFEKDIKEYELEELIRMAQQPNREILYTTQMLQILADEIASRR